MAPSPDVMTEVKTTATRIVGGQLSINSPEGQQVVYLALMVLGLFLIQFFPALAKQGDFLFTASAAVFFAKAKTT